MRHDPVSLILYLVVLIVVIVLLFKLLAIVL